MAQLPSEHGEKIICDGPHVFIRIDPRVTKVGQILHRSQIDVYLRFWNVLLGQMSVVSSRPSSAQEARYCLAWRSRAERSSRYHRAMAAQPDPICRKTIWVLLAGGRNRCA